MKVIIAYTELDGSERPDAAFAAGLEELARTEGHVVEHLVLPDASAASPQARALPWQLLPCAAYGDAVWAINFPACTLRHASRRVWVTRPEPFGVDPRAPVQALRSLIDVTHGAVHLVVASPDLARRLELGTLVHEIGLPPLPSAMRPLAQPLVAEKA
jgi:hypothetical protein